MNTNIGGAGLTDAQLMGENHIKQLPRNSVAKRVLDVTLASLALVFLAPAFLLICLLVKLGDGGPAMFAHRRYGVHGRTFQCLKFRSMVVDAEDRLRQHLADDPDAAAEWARDHKLRHDPRITRIGAFLRKTSLDELPQLINILRGQMSIVGPRPIVHEEVIKYGDRFKYYAATRPGLTGAWQVSGRNHIDYDTRVEMDADYVRTWSIWSDLRIILLTVPAVLLRRGAF